MDKKKADQQASPKHSAVDSTSGAAQRQRLLERLQEGPANTVELRRDLNIMMPAARVKELREAGHDIRTHYGRVHDDQGRLHIGVATYYLSTREASAA